VPRINLGYNQIGNEALTPQQGIPNVSGLTQEADALARLAQTGGKAYADIQQNRENMEMAKASTEFAKEIEAKRFEFEHEDTDFSTQDQRFQDFVKDRYESYEGQFSRPELYEQFKTNTDKFVFEKGLEIKSHSLKSNALEQQGILKSALDDISSLAIRGDQNQYDESFNRAESLIEHAFETGVIDTKERAVFEERFKKDLRRGKVRQDIAHDPAKALDKIQSNEYNLVSAEEQGQFEAMALSKIAQTKNKSSVEAKKQATELVSDTILSLNNGYIVQDEELDAARAASGLIGKEEDLEIAVAASQFVTLPKAVREDLPKSIQGVHNAELRDALEHANKTIETELDKDGYAFAVKQRVINETPLDLTDPASIQARLDQVDELRGHYGRSISPLSEAEADLLVEALPTMSPKQKAQLAKTFGPAEAIWTQLDKKNAGLFSMTGAIGDLQVMQNVFKGQQMLKDKLVTSVKQNDYLPVFNDYVSDIYVGKDRRQMMDAALAYYAATTESGTFDSGDFEDAIEAVSGGIGNINGHKVELPRGVPEDDFEDYIDNISSETIKEFGGVWSLSDDRAVDLVRKGRLVSYATNQYMITAENGAVLKAKNNIDPFLISFDSDIATRDKSKQLISRSERRSQNRSGRD
jgi:hypothetical protein